MKKLPISLFIIFLLIISFTLLLSSCGDDDDDDTDIQSTPYTLEDIPMFPTEYNIPADNPMTVEGIKLGRYLYYDGRLSGRTDCDSQMTCGTCHLQASGFEAGVDHPKFTGGHTFGITGIPTPHAMLAHVNLVYNNTGYLWNGMIYDGNTNLGFPPYGVPAEPQYHMKNIESLIWMSIIAPHEFHGNLELTLNMIKSIDIYPPMFKAAFGTEEITIDRISKAIAQFVRTIRSYNSKYHKWLRHEAGVTLTPQELHGMEMFMSEKADCFHCHGTILFTTNQFYNNAKDSCFTGPCLDTRDRYAVTKDQRDYGAYKAPSLINCELNGPYMHDGRFKTLREVVDFYASGLKYTENADPLMKFVQYGGNTLTEDEKDDLIAFLKTLTDHELLKDPQFSKPADLDTGCP